MSQVTQTKRTSSMRGILRAVHSIHARFRGRDQFRRESVATPFANRSGPVLYLTGVPICKGNERLRRSRWDDTHGGRVPLRAAGHAGQRAKTCEKSRSLPTCNLLVPIALGYSERRRECVQCALGVPFLARIESGHE